MTVASIKTELHRLVDDLPDSELAAAWRVLEALNAMGARREVAVGRADIILDNGPAPPPRPPAPAEAETDAAAARPAGDEVMSDEVVRRELNL